MKTIDQISKIKAVVLYILQSLKGEVDYIHLFKVMYFAQQEHLVVYGAPLLEDSFIARKHGPVPAFTYKALRVIEGKILAETPELQQCSNSMSVQLQNGHKVVSAIEDCDMDELSPSNIKILDKWIEKCRDVAAFDLSDLSHDIAWEKAKQQADTTGEDAKMPLWDIAQAGGATPGMLEVIRQRQINTSVLEWI